MLAILELVIYESGCKVSTNCTLNVASWTKSSELTFHVHISTT